MADRHDEKEERAAARDEHGKAADEHAKAADEKAASADEKAKDEKAKAVNEESAKANEKQPADAHPSAQELNETAAESMGSVPPSGGVMQAVASSQQHPPVPPDRSDPELEPTNFPKAEARAADGSENYIVLVTLLANNWEHGQIVAREELAKQGVNIEDRLAVGVIAKLDSDDPRIPAAMAARAAADTAVRKFKRDSGVASIA